MQSVNPFNGEVLGSFREYQASDIDKILEGAHGEFRGWRKTSFEHRGRLLHKVGDLLTDRCKDLANLITKEMGKRITESEGEVRKCSWVCHYYAEHAEEFLQNETLPVREAESYIQYDPLGVILAVMPWNFPFWQVFRFAAPAVMAGNAGILKHASNVPQCSLAIENLFREAGFPEGVFQSVLVKSGSIPGVIDDSRIAAITLTGSEEAGSSVAERAGRNIKKLVLELGGSDPFIVLADADIDKSAEVAAKARMINCGQSCIAAKRFIVHKEISGHFIEKLAGHLLKLEPGNPLDPATGYGPLAREDLVGQLEKQVNLSVKNGAKIITGGKRTQGYPETFYEPTIISEAVPGMPAFDEELFGPVAAVSIAGSDEEAVELANHSRFGLGASLWTRNIDKAKILSHEIESGSVFINDMVASHPAIPFGGIKMSGYGRELSHLGIREFMNIKSVWIRK